jgi:Zn ribbon nucleic-acid-binding protein
MEISMGAFRFKPRWLLLIGLLLALGLAGWHSTVQAQQTGYRLNLSRNFGYSSGSQIRGNFTASIVGPQDNDNIQSVTYLIDGKSIAEVTTAPFKLQFVTTDYPLGWHDMSAQIHTKDGQTATTAVQHLEFASADQESAAVKSITFPLLGGVLLIVIIALGAQMLAMRKKPKLDLPLGTSRKYGITGGAICPRCHRPFALHWWALNAGIGGKLDRCDFCGRWGMVRRASREELTRAEAAEVQMAQPEKPIQAESEEQKLKELLDESRYTDKS